MSNAAQNLEPVAPPAAPASPAPAAPAAAPAGAPVAPAAPAAIPTAITQPAASDDKPAVGDWPQDWRERYTTDDKRLKQLKRFASPEAALDAFFAAQNKITSGELVAKPGKDATPEEVKAWRESQGVPEKPEGYLEKLPGGLVIGEEDKELIGSFATEMHALDIPPAAVHKSIEWYYKTIDAQRQAEYDANRDALQSTQDALNAEYGPDYRRNMNLISGVIKTLPGEAGDMLANAKGPDGILLLNNPDFVRGMVQWAHQLNPVASLIPGASNPTVVQDRLKEIKSIMTTDLNRYRKDPAMQEEYQKLLEAQEKLSARG